MSIEQRICKEVAKILGVEESKAVPSAEFIKDLGADSLDRVELFLALEEQFNIQIEDGEADQIKTVEDAIYFIKRHQEAK